MKKILMMLGLLLGFTGQQQASADPITQPEAGKEYYVVHSSGMLLSQNSEPKLKIITAGENDQQVWKFEPATASTYYIKNAVSGKYLT